MDMWRSLAGMVEAELTSADIPSVLGSINGQGITVYEVRQIDELTAVLCLSRRGYSQAADMVGKRGATLRVLQRRGSFWLFQGLLVRPVFAVGALLLLALALYLPTRVYFVRVEGNSSVPARMILEEAEVCGIRFGASRREVRSESVKNALLEAVPQLQWAGVNTSGCVATISVRERSAEETADGTGKVSSIVASQDGYIVSATAIRGNLLCHPGQTVKRGQVLISGYTDCGICIQATRAEGEIFAQTNRDLTVITPVSCFVKGNEGAVKRRISMILGKKRINLWKDSGISDATCGRMYKEYYITLPGGFCLPAAICVETFTMYETEAAVQDSERVEPLLTEYAEYYLKKQMVAGSVLTGKQAMFSENAVYQLKGSYVCVEMIGRVQQERIGETNGKSD